jgi:hypothetical protein
MVRDLDEGPRFGLMQARWSSLRRPAAQAFGERGVQTGTFGIGALGEAAMKRSRRRVSAVGGCRLRCLASRQAASAKSSIGMHRCAGALTQLRVANSM